MYDARVLEELLVTAPTKVGLLAEVTGAIAGAGVDIHAMGAYDKGGNGEFLLITSDNDAAAAAIAAAGAAVERNDVVAVDLADSPGALAGVARMLAGAGVNVDWVYATTGDGLYTLAVLKVADPARAVEILTA